MSESPSSPTPEIDAEEVVRQAIEMAVRKLWEVGWERCDIYYDLSDGELVMETYMDMTSWSAGGYEGLVFVFRFTRRDLNEYVAAIANYIADEEGIEYEEAEERVTVEDIIDSIWEFAGPKLVADFEEAMEEVESDE